jgi:hypothetical protein
MSEKRISAYLVLLLLLLATLFLFRKGSHNWSDHYLPDSKDPYGLFLIKNALKGYFKDKKFYVASDSLPTGKGTGIFTYMDGYYFPDSARQHQIVQFVKSGNQAFIACENFPLSFFELIKRADNAELPVPPSTNLHLEELAGNDAALNFTHPGLHLDSNYVCRFRNETDTLDYAWRYFPDSLLRAFPAGLVRIGTINGNQVNCIGLPCGKGMVFLHATPLAFTNVNLLEGDGMRYAERLFSHLSSGDIYWEQYDWEAPGGQPSFASETPLKYVLSKPSLAWAWYILLGMAVLYLLFRAKRRQRIIPVLEQNINGSLEFIGTMGRLSFLQNNHRRLTQQEMKLFLSFVREKYHLSTKELDEAFVRDLAARSEVAEDLIRDIILLDRNIKSSGFISDATLIDFHNRLENFRRNCR